ncbi:MAG: hypothetical protein O7C98_15365 [Planctomycetota bacterium]|nr:hypothetical protein [Planctomycetota bacterium]
MNKPVLIGAAWCASLVLAWFLGSNAVEAPSYRADRDAEDRTVDRSGAERTLLESSGMRFSGKVPDKTRTPAGRKPKRDAAANTETAEESVGPFTLEGVNTAAELSRRFMAYADRKLKEGPEGRLELYRALDGLTQGPELHRLFRSEADIAPLAYPWFKFLMDRNHQVAALMEDLYKKAASEPAWFEGTDDDTLEIFTEGMAVMLPGFADAEMMERMTGYVEQILQHDKERVPKAVQRNRREFQRNLEFWSGPVSAEDALQQLQDPSLSNAAAMELLRRVDPSALKGIDVQPILVTALKQGNRNAMGVIAKLGAGAGDQRVFDSAFMEAIGAGSYNQWQIRTYLDVTRRSKWADARYFMEEGLSRGGKTAERFGMALGWMPEQPPKEFIEQVLDGYVLPEHVQTHLRNRFGIK